MDDNNNQSNGGPADTNPAPAADSAPAEPNAAPAEPGSAPAAAGPATEAKCEKCGGASENGMCKSCNMQNGQCTCPPAQAEGSAV